MTPRVWVAEVHTARSAWRRNRCRAPKQLLSTWMATYRRPLYPRSYEPYVPHITTHVTLTRYIRVAGARFALAAPLVCRGPAPLYPPCGPVSRSYDFAKSSHRKHKTRIRELAIVSDDVLAKEIGQSPRRRGWPRRATSVPTRQRSQQCHERPGVSVRTTVMPRRPGDSPKNGSGTADRLQPRAHGHLQCI